MSGNRNDIERVEALANLIVDPGKESAIEDDFKSIMSFVDEIHDTDTTETAATEQVTDLENVFRSDDVVEFRHHRSMFEMTPHRENGMYRVPGVFSDDPEEHGS